MKCSKTNCGTIFTNNCKNYTDCLVKKVRSGFSTIIPDPTWAKVPDPDSQH
jgi:hypothetical protein